MTFAEIRADVFRRLGESSTAPVYWTEDDVNTAINEGYAEISDSAEWYERWATIDLLAHRPYYDLRHVLPDTVLSVGRVFNNQTNRWLEPCSVTDLDAHDRRWEVVTGEPTHVFLRGLWWVGYYPRVTQDAGTVTQYYTALPPALVNDSDEPGFPESAHQALVEYALAELWAQDGEVTQATAAWQTYLAHEAALTAWASSRVGVPLVHRGGGRVS